jgi:hypothetical protein
MPKTGCHYVTRVANSCEKKLVVGKYIKRSGDTSGDASMTPKVTDSHGSCMFTVNDTVFVRVGLSSCFIVNEIDADPAPPNDVV